ncbi:MAG: hypothetical protein ACOY3Y_11950, partial [Acidobacteriota bacterium]
MELPFSAGPVLLRTDIPTVGDVKGGDRFGHALAAGRVDGDRCDDLIVGVPGVGARWERQGAVQVRFGNDPLIDSPLADGVELAVLSPLDSAHDGDQLGWTIALGDFNLDHRDDIAIGAPESRDPGGQPGAGRVFVCYGSWSGFGAGQDITERCEHFDSNPLEVPSGPDHDRFGWALAAVDLDGDEIEDLAVGAPGDPGAEGGLV